MNSVDKILGKLEHCILNGTYEKIETDKYELKDNSSSNSDWKQVYVTTNAFLNTKGGIIFIGINEDVKNEKYIFKGFDFRNEEKVKELPKKFTNESGDKLDLGLYFPNYEIRDFLTGKILVVYVDVLPEAEKYVYYEKNAYERVLTGDHSITPQKIKAHNEYKEQIKQARELLPVINTTIDDLDIDKLNHFIFLLNRNKKSENQKSNIQEAKSFLLRKMMITKEEQPTILGMLTCGTHPEDFLFNKCEIDCYVDHPSADVVARSKKIFQDTVIALMEEGERFVIQNISTGIHIERSGSSIYEYPLELIRESINNSLAHRDYSIDRFVTIRVSPGKQIEIRNPGQFKQQLLIEYVYESTPIRRIIPGNPKASNPRLADVLKVFDKWEGQGIGMATLTGACLDNQIDLPYYIFHSSTELSLIIPSGRLVDENMESLFDTYSGYFKQRLNGNALTEEQKRVLAYLYKSELANSLFRHTILLTKDNNHLDAIRSLIDAKLIFPHSKSDTINPVYLLDRQLFISDFSSELEKLFGKDFVDLKSEYKEILNLVYESNNFSESKFPSANQIGNILWLRRGNASVLEGFEDFKRKVRYIVSRLEISEFIVRESDSPRYSINQGFGKNDLFRAT